MIPQTYTPRQAYQTILTLNITWQMKTFHNSLAKYYKVTRIMNLEVFWHITTIFWACTASETAIKIFLIIHTFTTTAYRYYSRKVFPLNKQELLLLSLVQLMILWKFARHMVTIYAGVYHQGITAIQAFIKTLADILMVLERFSWHTALFTNNW